MRLKMLIKMNSEGPPAALRLVVALLHDHTIVLYDSRLSDQSPDQIVVTAKFEVVLHSLKLFNLIVFMLRLLYF